MPPEGDMLNKLQCRLMPEYYAVMKKEVEPLTEKNIQVVSLTEKGMRLSIMMLHKFFFKKGVA